jgi:hypothetical protein|tara:strand:+ start:92 stop:238 length:147 start_codon:yes stop_codon:yes gene_type:complete
MKTSRSKMDISLAKITPLETFRADKERLIDTIISHLWAKKWWKRIEKE